MFSPTQNNTSIAMGRGSISMAVIPIIEDSIQMKLHTILTVILTKSLNLYPHTCGRYNDVICRPTRRAESYRKFNS